MILNRAKTEKIIILLVFICSGLTILTLFTDKSLWDFLVKEDSVVEWLTVAALLGSALLFLCRFIRLRNTKSKVFLIMLLIYVMAFIFGAGEEISWGQRIFDLEPGRIFVEHNAQNEINLHNMKLFGLKLNKVLFTNLIVIFLIFFLIVLPVLYRKSRFINNLTEKFAVPVPRLYQVIAYFIPVLMISLLTDPRRFELLEMAGAAILLAVFINPLNSGIYSEGEST